MKRWPIYLLLLCAWLLPAAVTVIPGVPYGQVTISINRYTGTNIPSGTCRGPALIQTKLTDMWVKLDTTSSVPLATDFFWASGDFFEVREPARVRARGISATGDLVVICLD